MVQAFPKRGRPRRGSCCDGELDERRGLLLGEWSGKTSHDCNLIRSFSGGLSNARSDWLPCLRPMCSTLIRICLVSAISQPLLRSDRYKRGDYLTAH